MKRLGNPSITGVALLPVALYALLGAVIVVVWPKLFRGSLKEVLIWSSFLSLMIAALGIWRILKQDRAFPILISTLLGIVGTLLWGYVVWRNISLQ